MKPRFFEKTAMRVAAFLMPLMLCGLPSQVRATVRKTKPAAKISRAVDEERQRRFNTFYLEAAVQREQGNIDEAYELLRHAHEIIPDAPEALFDMARIKLAYDAVDTTNTAELYLRRAVELEPDNYYFQKELADYYDFRNMPDSAAARYEAMTEHFKARSDLYFSLIDIYSQKKNYEALVKTLEKLEVAEGKSEEITIKKIGVLREMNQTDRAVEEVNHLIDLYPADQTYRVLRGEIYLDENRPELAMAEYEKVLAVEPNNDAANVALMYYYEGMGNDSTYVATAAGMVKNRELSTRARATAFRQLMDAFSKGKTDSLFVAATFRTVSEEPEPDVTLLNLYQAYLIVSPMPVDSVAPVWKQILALQPDYAQLRLKLLQYNIQKEDFATAARLCEEGAQYEPDQLAYYLYGGMAMFSLKENERAVQMLRRGTEQISPETPDDLASDIFSSLGDVYHEMKLQEQAYQAYDSALAYKPDNAATLNNYAYYLSLERRDLDRAAEMSLRTVKSQPDNAVYLDTYAWVLFVQGKIEEAQAYIDKALKNLGSEEGNAVYYEHAGDISAVAGRKAEAVEMWKKAQSLGSDSKTLKKKIKSKKYISQ